MVEQQSDMSKVKDFFGMTGGEMLKEWKMLTDEDRAQIKSGIVNGTFTY